MPKSMTARRHLDGFGADAVVRQWPIDIRWVVRQGLRYVLARRVLLSVVPLLAGMLVLDLVREGNEPLWQAVRSREWLYTALSAMALLAYSWPGRWLTALDLPPRLVTNPSGAPYSGEDQALLAAIGASLVSALARQGTPAAGLAPGDPGLLANRYRLGHKLGTGGMGTVFSAVDVSLGREVAVKLVREDRLGSRHAALRFHREAKAAAAFAHPNVVTVHDYGVDTVGRAYLVMERLEGCDLRNELARGGRLSAVRTLDILQGVCAALDAAHRQRLVHRDLKPANVFLARGQAGPVSKVLDFGVATFVSDGDSEVETATRALVGTRGYMAPEAIAGGSARPAWDLWALAVMTYEMLTGVHPFAPSGPHRTAAVLEGRFAALAAHCPDAPASWHVFFAGALAADSAQRPASAGDFLASLARCLRDPGAPPDGHPGVDFAPYLDPPSATSWGRPWLRPPSSSSDRSSPPTTAPCRPRSSSATRKACRASGNRSRSPRSPRRTAGSQRAAR